jgi:hypothetical protein
MKCKTCGTENAPLKKTCESCNLILEGFCINNMTGEYGYRNADGSFDNDESGSLVVDGTLRSFFKPKN